MNRLPKYFVPMPPGLLPKMDAMTSTRFTGRWCRAQTAFWDRPPTTETKSGYGCVIVPNTKIYKVGLKHRYDKIGLAASAVEAEMGFDEYIGCLSRSLGDNVVVKDRKPPYEIDVVKRTCTCPDFVQHGQPCFHLMAVLYGLKVGCVVTKNNVVKFRIGAT